MLDPRLNHVVAVSRSGSFTAAAQIVGVTQSAVTKSIADLEQQIGYSIFYRTGRGIILTERGRNFVDRAQRLLEDARDLLDAHAQREDAFAGTLRIGVCPASLEWRIAEPLTKLLRRHPSIRFDVSSSSFESMVQQLRNGRVDVAVGFDVAFKEWTDFKRSSMEVLHSALFVRKDHPLLERPSVTEVDLARYDFVSPSDSRPYGEIIRNIYASQSIDWQRHLHTIDYFPTVRRIVATSDSIGIVALRYTRSPKFQRDFGTLNIPDIFPLEPLCCAVRARWEPKPAVRAFVAMAAAGEQVRDMNFTNTI